MGTILVTGGCGFIGSALVRRLCNDGARVVVIDKLGQGSSRQSITLAEQTDLVELVKMDICDTGGVKKVLNQYKPEAVFHLAAESHVDRSISGPAPFVNSNIVGTFSMLEAWRHYAGNGERFIHVSTDEVFGDLDDTSPPFQDTSPYAPSSPYSASKAASDHLVRAWVRTYGLNAVVTNCSNNFGPYQSPEKLIPRVILCALNQQSIPVFGKGNNIRDWLFVEDHVDALLLALANGCSGASYLVGGNNEISNLDLVTKICREFDCKVTARGNSPSEDLISFVADRPGHDFRYAINAEKTSALLGWQPRESLQSGLSKTLDWYLSNQSWLSGANT